MEQKLYDYLLMLGDNAMILGHRLSELCGHGPNLETDIALTNISLDLFGQVRHYFQYATSLNADIKDEDVIAFKRLEHEYRNTLLVQQPNTDFAYVIARQFYFDAYHLPLLQELQNSSNQQISAIAKKSIKEVRYHHRFSEQWIKRLGDGTEVSREKIQAAIDYLWPYVAELFEETPLEAEMKEAGIGADLSKVRQAFDKHVKETLQEATLSIPDNPYRHKGGKKGIHSEHMGYILADLQYMQRAYPDMAW